MLYFQIINLYSKNLLIMFTEKQKKVIDSALASESRENKVRQLARWFEFSLVIKLFGVNVVKLKFPPENVEEEPSYEFFENDC